MEIINLDDNIDLNDIIEDLNPSPIDLNMSGGAEPSRVFNNFKAGDKTLYLAEVWEVKSVDGNDVVITKGDKEKKVSKKKRKRKRRSVEETVASVLDEIRSRGLQNERS